MTVREKKIRDELIDLNDKFRSLELFPLEFYRQISHKNVDVASSVLVDVLPDSSNTYIGRLIDQEDNIWSFDIDLDNASYSEWDDITEGFCRLLKEPSADKKHTLEFLAKKMMNQKSQN